MQEVVELAGTTRATAHARERDVVGPLTAVYENGASAPSYAYEHDAGIVRGYPANTRLRFDEDGSITERSANRLLRELSRRSGRGGPAQGIHSPEADAGAIDAFAQSYGREYSFTHNNCTNFARDALSAGLDLWDDLFPTVGGVYRYGF